MGWSSTGGERMDEGFAGESLITKLGESGRRERISQMEKIGGTV